MIIFKVYLIIINNMFLIDIISSYFYFINNDKQNIILLGDGFFARGFLHNINHKKFHITQIYKDEFINPSKNSPS